VIDVTPNQSPQDKAIESDEDESVNEKQLPPAWQRHLIVLSFGAGAVYFSTDTSSSLLSVMCALSFLKLSKSYMAGFPRFRRYCATGALLGSAIGVKTLWDKVSLVPLVSSLAIDALTVSAKAYMKGKLKKDAGPEETFAPFLYVSNGLSSCYKCISSCFVPGMIQKSVLAASNSR
jgi:hypothetical protein